MRDKDPLFIGMTRPPMIAGVTFLYMGMNAFSVAFIYVIIKNPLILLIGIPIHAVGYLLCLKDPQLLDVIVKRAQKSSGVPNVKYWGGKSYRQ